MPAVKSGEIRLSWVLLWQPKKRKCGWDRCWMRIYSWEMKLWVSWPGSQVVLKLCSFSFLWIMNFSENFMKAVNPFPEQSRKKPILECYFRVLYPLMDPRLKILGKINYYYYDSFLFNYVSLNKSLYLSDFLICKLRTIFSLPIC